VSEQFLVAGDTIRVFLFEDVAAGDEFFITVVASQVILVVILLHGFCILPRKYQLETRKKCNKCYKVTNLSPIIKTVKTYSHEIHLNNIILINESL